MTAPPAATTAAADELVTAPPVATTAAADGWVTARTAATAVVGDATAPPPETRAVLDESAASSYSTALPFELLDITPFASKEYGTMAPMSFDSEGAVQDSDGHDNWIFPEHLQLNQTEYSAASSNLLLYANEHEHETKVPGPSESRKPKRVEKPELHGEKRKKNVCIYCKQKKSLIWRHLKTLHRDEKEVNDILECDDEDQSKLKTGIMINKGNFEYNKFVLKSGQGEMILGRKSDQVSASDYMPCPYCYLFVIKTNMKQHLKNSCLARNAEECQDMPTVMAASRTLLTDGQEENTGYHRDILARMHDDEVTKTLRNDELIYKFGANLYEKLGKSGFSQISQRLRMIAEVVQAAGKSMDELIDGNGFETAVSATKSVCGYDQNKLNAHTGLPTYKTPSKAMRIGGELKQLAALKKGVGLAKKNDITVKDAEGFSVPRRSVLERAS